MHWAKEDPKWLVVPAVGVSVVCGQGCRGVCLLMGRGSDHTLLRTGRRAFSDSQGMAMQKSIRISQCVSIDLPSQGLLHSGTAWLNCAIDSYVLQWLLCSAVRSCSRQLTWLTAHLSHSHGNHRRD